MESIEFVLNFEKYVEEISTVIKPELLPILNELKGIDLHDLVRPEAYFSSEKEARGVVWSMFLKNVSKSQK